MAYFKPSEATLSKPYITSIKRDIESSKPIKTVDGLETFIINGEIEKLFKAVDSADERKISSIIGSGRNINPIFETKSGKVYKFNQIDKAPYSGMGGSKKADAKTTAMQERASLIAIKKSIEKNGFSDKIKFLKECKSEMLKEYPDMDGEWEETFYQQGVTVQKQVGNTKFDHYSRDDGFMDDITKMVKNYGISKKDTWNPADIWLVNNLTENKKKLQNIIDDDATPITHFNDIMRDMFINGEVIGISLKKVSGKKALWELVNVKIKGPMFDKEGTYKVDSIISKFSTNKGVFSSTDTVIKMSNNVDSINFQIRQNSRGFSNLKFEGTSKGASKARLGKSPVDMVANLMKSYGLTSLNNHNKFPKSAADFIQNKNTHIDKFKTITNWTDINVTEFETHMIDAFNKNPSMANSKLMQLHFLAELAKIPKNKLDDFLTSMAYLSMKKGKVFGPFAKLF